MIILDYDEFGIYTTTDDVKNYISQLFESGIESETEIYELCLNHFGNIYDIIDSALYE
jgi:hypothetical protein